jgi:hypothetical protein
MALVVLCGTAAFARFFPDNQWIGLLTAALGLSDLVFDLSGRARLHASLRRQCYSLLADLEAGGEVKAIKARLIASYGDEPPQNGTVNSFAYNAAMLSMDRPARHLVKIGGWRRFFRHWISDDADLRTFAEMGEEPPSPKRPI